jgi:hypothetical protein
MWYRAAVAAPIGHVTIHTRAHPAIGQHREFCGTPAALFQGRSHRSIAELSSRSAAPPAIDWPSMVALSWITPLIHNEMDFVDARFAGPRHARAASKPSALSCVRAPSQGPLLGVADTLDEAMAAFRAAWGRPK